MVHMSQKISKKILEGILAISLSFSSLEIQAQEIPRLKEGSCKKVPWHELYFNQKKLALDVKSFFPSSYSLTISLVKKGMYSEAQYHLRNISLKDFERRLTSDYDKCMFSGDAFQMLGDQLVFEENLFLASKAYEIALKCYDNAEPEKKDIDFEPVELRWVRKEESIGDVNLKLGRKEAAKDAFASVIFHLNELSYTSFFKKNPNFDKAVGRLETLIKEIK